GAASSCRRRWAPRSRGTRLPPPRDRPRAARAGRADRRTRRLRTRALAASERPPQLLQVPAHQRQVGIAVALLGRSQAFDRVEDGDLRARIPSDGLREARRDQTLEEDRRDVFPADEGDQTAEPLRARLRLRVDAGDGNLVQAVASGEVTEGRMARDEVASGAVRETAAVLAVERK